MITSLQNPKIKQARALSQRKQRDKTGLFVVEGIRHVGELLASNYRVEYICYAPDLLTSLFAHQLIEDATQQGVPTLPTTPEIFKTLAEKNKPQGIIAVSHRKIASLEQLTPEAYPWNVALVAPQDPGNIGTILRTMDAVGAHGLFLLDGGVDPFHPTAVRASMGALFWHPVIDTSVGAFFNWAREYEVNVTATSSHGEVDYREAHYPAPRVLLMGSEQKGLSPRQAGACSQRVRIPMAGRGSSLNLAVAAGVMLYEMGRN